MNKTIVSAFIAGLIAGTGLIISQMVNPEKVLNFFDVIGTWDPSLAFVMLGGLLVTTPGFYLLKQRGKPLYDLKFHWPDKTEIPFKFMLGAALFGIGWGLIGLCPGPAIAALFKAPLAIGIFIVCMMAGSYLAKKLS